MSLLKRIEDGPDYFRKSLENTEPKVPAVIEADPAERDRRPPFLRRLQPGNFLAVADLTDVVRDR